MAVRITKYYQAFDLLNMNITPKIEDFLQRMEADGHSEKSICFCIWKKQDKLCAFRCDPRFLSVLENEINKWSWKKGDPRWDEYWKRKNEEKRAERMRQELDNIRVDAEIEKKIITQSRKPTKKHRGYVYFIQGLCGGAIKVGYSVNPEKRLKELQTGYPDTLTILLMIPGDEKIERHLHREFEASRLQGEWFRPDDLVIKRIKELKALYSEAVTAAKGR